MDGNLYFQIDTTEDGQDSFTQTRLASAREGCHMHSKFEEAQQLSSAVGGLDAGVRDFGWKQGTLRCHSDDLVWTVMTKAPRSRKKHKECLVQLSEPQNLQPFKANFSRTFTACGVCLSQQSKSSLLFRGASTRFTSTVPEKRIPVESLAETSSHGSSWSSVGRLWMRSRQGEPQHDSVGRFPLFALAFATTFASPLMGGREFATESNLEGVIDEGCKSTATRAGGYKWLEVTPTCRQPASTSFPFGVDLAYRCTSEASSASCS
ncbi:hypothetical protein Esti_006649 [Eimeria stiedai]